MKPYHSIAILSRMPYSINDGAFLSLAPIDLDEDVAAGMTFALLCRSVAAGEAEALAYIERELKDRGMMLAEPLVLGVLAVTRPTSWSLREAPDSRRNRPQALGSEDRLHWRVAHVGIRHVVSSPYSLCRSRRRAFLRSEALGCVSAEVPTARQRPLRGLPRKVHRLPAARVSYLSAPAQRTPAPTLQGRLHLRARRAKKCSSASPA